MTKREHKDESKHMHPSLKPKAVASTAVCCFNNNNVKCSSGKSVCASVSIIIQQTLADIQSVLVTMATPAPNGRCIREKKTGKQEKK